jgi:hypothetical protein
MKQQRFWGVSLLLILSMAPLLTGCLQNGGHGTEQASSPPDTAPIVVTQPAQEEASAEALDQEVSDAPVKRVSADRPLPPKIKENPALAEVVEFSNSGVHETVLLTYVANSTATFGLGPDEIIYLNDVGVPPAVVAAMIEHDALVKQPSPETVQQPSPLTATNPPVVASAPTYSVLPNWDQASEPVGPAPAEYTELYADSPPEAEAAPLFYDSLAPYGTWVDVEGYGRCWQPSVVVANPDWRPYCDRGHWVYTDCGWYWASDYSWGWAPFHYGRWFQHGRLGWCWTPDRVWGPSWVSWRYSNDYCGWAPLPPRACYTAAGLTYNGHLAAVNFNFNLRPDCYTFVHYDRLHDRRLSSHKLSRDHVDRIINKTVVSTKIIGGQRTVSNDGLSPDKVAAVTKRPVQRATIREVNSSTDKIVSADKVDPTGQTVTVVKPSWRPPVRSLTTAAAADPAAVPASPASRLWDRPGSSARPGSYTTRTADATVADAPTAPALPRRPVRTRDAETIPVAQPVHPVQPTEVATATAPRTWQRPRSIEAAQEIRAASPLIIRRQSDVTSQPAQAAPDWQWQPGPSAGQAASPARAAARTWQTPRNDSPRVAAPTYEAAAPVRTFEPPAASPRWDRPRQEPAPQAVASPRGPTWQTPARSAPSESPRSAQANSAPARSSGSSGSSSQSQSRNESRSSSSSSSSRQENSSSRSQSSDNSSRGGRR